MKERSQQPQHDRARHQLHRERFRAEYAQVCEPTFGPSHGGRYANTRQGASSQGATARPVERPSSESDPMRIQRPWLGRSCGPYVRAAPYHSGRKKRTPVRQKSTRFGNEHPYLSSPAD